VKRPLERSGDGPLFAWGDALRAARIRRARLGRRIAITTACIGALLISTAWRPAPRLVWNASASAPIGLYWVTPGALIQPGDMVIAQAPARFRRLAAERRYLPMNVPLVKHVVAFAGDDVCALGQTISVNGRPIAERRRVDSKGRPMPTWTGCIRLRGRQIFLLMDDRASFDGRYFGPTENTDVVGKATLLWRR
jgi:conjugative transfer signal peptidase TraF